MSTTAIPTSNDEKLKKPLQLGLFMLLGVSLILISVIIKHVVNKYPILYDLINSIGQAFIIGPALSWVLDLQSMVDYFKKITIKTLISKEYLRTLDREKLLELRKVCTEKIHLKDSKVVERGLINLDESVCELLTKPYYERIVQNTYSTPGDDFFTMKSIIEEHIVHPLGTKISFADFPKTYLQIGDQEDIKTHYNILNFTVQIDEGTPVDWKEKILLHKSEINQADSHYNSEVLLYDDALKQPLSIDFTRSLIINRTFEVKVPKTDIVFIKRVRMPVKSLNIQCTYKGDDHKLVGSCFGSLSFPNKGIRVIQEDNSISLESYNWILPGDGFFIVKVPKK